MVYKLAITISGAVSLGTFESGALYEVLESIAKHNEEVERNKVGERIEVDVLTGASAGGMTACIAARKLLYEADDLRGATSNSFYGAWVKRVGLDPLLKLGPKEEKQLSILSSDLVRKIAADYLEQERPSNIPPKKHPACADTLWLGLALSNLNGVDFSVPMFGGQACKPPAPTQGRAIQSKKVQPSNHLKPAATGEFVYTRYQDEYTKLFTSSFALDSWKEVSLAAVSCGAFPFAFRPVTRTVPDSHYEQAGASHLPGSDCDYLFTDGGVFQNEPLGLAKNLVDIIDQTHENNDLRYYLYIAPGAKTSSQNASPLKLDQASSFNMASSLIQSIFNQSRFHDWITAEATNEQVLLLDKRADELKTMLLSGAIKLSATEIMSFTTPFLDFLYGNVTDKQDAATRLKKQYQAEFNAFQDTSLAEAWLSIVQLLEKAAALGTRDQMKIFGITANESELAGGKLLAFQGFFGFDLREHDYNYGRIKAREILRQLKIFNNVVPTNDNDIDLKHNLDDFNALGSPDSQYIILLSRLGNRALDYFVDGIIRFLLTVLRTHPWLAGVVLGVIAVALGFVCLHFRP